MKKLTAKELEAVAHLRELDVQERDKLLSDIRRAALATRITLKAARKAGQMRNKLRTVADHKIVKAYGTLPKKKR